MCVLFHLIDSLVKQIVSLGSGPPLANHNPAIFSVSHQTLKNLASPPGRQKTLNSNLLHMFNNNTYVSFKTSYKHVLIPSYVIGVI